MRSSTSGRRATPSWWTSTAGLRPGLDGGGAYGGRGLCSSIVHSAVRIESAAQTGSHLIAGALPVDLAVSQSGVVAVAAAGSNQVVLVGLAQLIEVGGPKDCAPPGMVTEAPGQPVAVAFSPSGTLWIQTHQGITDLAGAPVRFPVAPRADVGRGLACASCHPRAVKTGGYGASCRSAQDARSRCGEG